MVHTGLFSKSMNSDEIFGVNPTRSLGMYRGPPRTIVNGPWYYRFILTVIGTVLNENNKWLFACHRSKKSSSVHLYVLLSLLLDCRSRAPFSSFSLVLQFQKKSWKNLFISSIFHTKIQKPTEIIISQKRRDHLVNRRSISREHFHIWRLKTKSNNQEKNEEILRW